MTYSTKQAEARRERHVFPGCWAVGRSGCWSGGGETRPAPQHGRQASRAKGKGIFLPGNRKANEYSYQVGGLTY